MYDPKQPKPADSLHRLGEELPFAVRSNSEHFCFECSPLNRELFGDSEDEAPEVDNTENPDNGWFNFIYNSALELTPGQQMKLQTYARKHWNSKSCDNLLVPRKPTRRSLIKFFEGT